MTQRIASLVLLLTIVFHFQTSFAQDDLTLDDSFAAEPATPETSVAPMDAAVTPTVIPAETDELSLDSELEAASAGEPAIDAQPTVTETPTPLDTMIDSEASLETGDPFETMTAAQNVDPAENVNLASPIELRQREAALFGFSAGLIISAQPLQEIYDVTNLSGSVPISTTRVNKQTNSIQSVGVMLRYAETPFYRIGTDLNISYLKSQNHNSITIKNTQTMGEITTLKGELNLSYAIEAGNIPIYFLAGFGAEKMTGKEIEDIINAMGYGGQIGGGFVINSTINLEAMYAYYVHRVSNAVEEGYATSKDGKGLIDTEEAKVINQGLILRGTFSFNF